MLADGIRWLIGACARHPWTTIGIVLAGAVAGWISLLRTPLDAHPRSVGHAGHHPHGVAGAEPGPRREIRSPIRSRRRCSRRPRVQFVRGHSMFGVSFVYVIFDDGTDLYWARSRVLEYLTRRSRARSPRARADARVPTRRRWAGSSSTRSSTRAATTTCNRCARSRTGRCATRSRACRRGRGRDDRRHRQAVPDRARSRTARRQRHHARRGDRRRCARSNQDAGGSVLEIAGHEHVIRGRGLRADSLDDLRDTVVDVAAGRHAGAPRSRRRGRIRPRAAARHRRARRTRRGRRRHRRHALRRERAAT